MKHRNVRKVSHKGIFDAIGAIFSAATLFTPAAPAAFGSTAFWKGATTAGTALGGLGTTITTANAIAGLGLAASGITGYKQKQAQEEAAAAERRRVELQNRVQENQAQQARIQALREQRVRTGAIVSNAANAGVVSAGTSPVVTGQTAVASQFGQNIGQINTQVAGARAVGEATSGIYQAQGEAQQWKDLGGFAGKVFDNRQFISSGLNSIFA
jgi:hypothetical protein